MPPNPKQQRSDNHPTGASDASLRMRAPGRASRVPTGTGLPFADQMPQPNAQYVPESISSFRSALLARNKSDAMLAWGKTTAEDRKSYAAYSGLNADLSLMVSVIGTQVVGIMSALHVDFKGRQQLTSEILNTVGGQWVDALVGAGTAMWQSFLATMPDRRRITEKQAKAWGRFVYAANSKQAAKAAFERVFPRLRDSSYDPANLQVAPWQPPDIHRLYRVLTSHLVVSHVQMAKDFSLGTIYEGRPMKIAFWQKSGGHIVLAAKSAAAKGGDKRRPESMRRYRFFERAALHEVGHAVGDHQGGHNWGRKYIDWQWYNLDYWSEKLWEDDDVAQIRAMGKAQPGTPVVPSEHARLYIAHRIGGTHHPVPGFHDREMLEAAIRHQYGEQPLTKYWLHVQKNEGSPYMFPGRNNYSNGRVWVFSKTWKYSGYKQSAHEHVMKSGMRWYALSAPEEWFAVNYESYYRDGGAENDEATKVKLGLLEAEKERKEKQDRVADSSRKLASAGPSVQRLPFPWS